MPSPVPCSASERLLVVDDDEGLLILMAESLRTEGYTVATCTSARAARQWLGEHEPDLLILDLKLPDAAGPALVASLQQTSRQPVPFIVVTGQGDEKVAVEIMKQGARDYVMKDSGLIDLLPSIVRRVLAAIAQEKDLTAAQAERRRLEEEILAIGERERLSIGADLHDNLGQQLTALELMCTVLREDAAGQPLLARRLGEMGKLLREAIAQTRFLARGLVPVGREPDALQVGLGELAGRVDALGRVHCHFECPQPVALSNPLVAGHLYRIAQEAVNNAMKYSRAKNITIRLVESDEKLVLEIVDDGVGMAQGVDKTPRGVGREVMQHRARAIGAELLITSRAGDGVAIRCSRPHLQ